MQSALLSAIGSPPLELSPQIAVPSLQARQFRCELILGEAQLQSEGNQGVRGAAFSSWPISILILLFSEFVYFVLHAVKRRTEQATVGGCELHAVSLSKQAQPPQAHFR